MSESVEETLHCYQQESEARMNRLAPLLFIWIFTTAAWAEPITFGFSREGVGYEAVDKPQLLNLLQSDTLFITTGSG